MKLTVPFLRHRPTSDVVRRSVCLLHALEHGPASMKRVNVRLEVDVVPVLDDRQRHVLPVVDATVPVRMLDPDEIALAARRHRIGVDVDAPDALVQIQKLRDRDGALVEGPQAVLDTDVVVVGAREAGERIDPHRIDRAVLQGPSCAPWVACGVVSQRLRTTSVESVCRPWPIERKAQPAIAVGPPAGINGVTVDLRSPLGGPDCWVLARSY